MAIFAYCVEHMHSGEANNGLGWWEPGEADSSPCSNQGIIPDSSGDYP